MVATIIIAEIKTKQIPTVPATKTDQPDSGRQMGKSMSNGGDRWTRTEDQGNWME
jgi:hypothetical protein